MTEKIIDNGTPGYSDAGAWLLWNGPGYFNNNARYSLGGGAGGLATWTFTGLPAGTYQVSANWAPYSAHASNAAYTIKASGVTTLVTADQRPESAGDLVGGVKFQVLTTVTVGVDGSLVVTVSDKGNGIVVADAVRVVNTAPPPAPVRLVSADVPPVKMDATLLADGTIASVVIVP